MKTILAKCKINTTTYFIFLSFLLTGFIKNAILIFFIVFIHELGHVFFLKCFHVSIEKVEIYPFGGLTTTNKYINFPINKDILIYIGGILFQMILFFLFSFFYSKHWITNHTFSLFNRYNKSIMFFNLLPMKPLDGGEMLTLLLQKFLPYKKTLRIQKYISIAFFLLFLFINIKNNLNSYIILSYLLFQMITFIKRINYYQNKFLLERYLHTIPFKKIEHNTVNDLSVLKKETLHFFKVKNKYVHEKEILQRKFDKKAYFW